MAFKQQLNEFASLIDKILQTTGSVHLIQKIFYELQVTRYEIPDMSYELRDMKYKIAPAPADDNTVQPSTLE